MPSNNPISVKNIKVVVAFSGDTNNLDKNKIGSELFQMLAPQITTSGRRIKITNLIILNKESIIHLYCILEESISKRENSIKTMLISTNPKFKILHIYHLVIGDFFTSLKDDLELDYKFFACPCFGL